jgi:hypothetical protein
MYAVVKADDSETHDDALSHERAVPHGGDPLMLRFNSVEAVYVTASDAVRVEFPRCGDAIVGENGTDTPGAEIIDVRV